MSYQSQTYETPCLETVENLNFVLGTDFNFDALYPTPIIMNDDYLSTILQQPSQNAHTVRASRVRASLACIQCRSRHLKCDAEPVCSRCRADNIQCIYTKSRRGGNRRAGVREATHDPVPNPLGSTGAALSTDFTSGAVVPVNHPEIVSDMEVLPDIQSNAHAETEEPEKLLDLYYEKFHDAHPLVLPRSQLEARLQTDPESLKNLILVMECIGSVYKADESYDSHRQAAHAALTTRPLPRNGFSVQSLLLFALNVHYCDEYEAANAILDRAIDMALSIEMFRQPFAQSNGENDAILQESWRRTAWGLFNTDAVFAAICHYPSHRLQTTIIDVDLPCEDHEYVTGDIPRPRTLTDYDNREFDENEIVFSSFAYFIDVGRILSFTIPITQQGKDPSDLLLQAADAKIITWFLHLPKCKQEIIRESREVDEIMFLAHLWINTEKLLVHRPYSQLQYSSAEIISKISPNVQTRASRKSITLHTTKTLEAIEAAFQLFALPSCYLKHSPIVTASLVLFIMAQVSACMYVFRQGNSKHLASRERVRMGLGVLRAHENYWGMTRRSVNEAKGIARQLIAFAAAVDTAASSGDGSGGGSGIGTESASQEGNRSRNGDLVV